MFPLQPQRELHLLQLALHGALLGQEQVFRELLGQGRATLRDAPVQQVGDRGARDADRIDTVMRIEPAVLDRDKGVRQVRRQLLQRHIGAGHLAALRQHAAVETRDLDGRRPLGDFQRLNRRQMRAGPDHRTDQPDSAPQAEHQAPIGEARQAGANARPGAALACTSRRFRLALARRRVVVFDVIGIGFRRGLFRLRLFGRRDAVLWRQPQRRERGQSELRLLASALFLAPRHRQRRSHHAPRHASGRSLRVGKRKINAGFRGRGGAC